MKKLWILGFLLFVLCSCKTSEAIYNNMYIASIGFEKTEKGYTGYFYLPSSLELGNTEQGKSEEPASLAVMEEETILDVFQGFELTSFLRMNLKHISTILLHESMLEDESIVELISYIRNSNYFEHNFYFMVTKDKLEDIYKVENPNQESVIRTILCEPITTTYTYGASKPIHFLNFCRDYFEGKTVSIPLLETDAIWKEDTDSVISKGVGFVSQKGYLLLPYEEADFMLIEPKNHMEVSIKDYRISLMNYTWSISYHQKYTKIKIHSAYEVISSKEENITSFLEETYYAHMQELIDTYQPKIDFLNLEYHDALNKEIQIEVKFELRK